MYSTSSAAARYNHQTEVYHKCHASFADIHGPNSSLLHNLVISNIRTKKSMNLISRKQEKCRREGGGLRFTLHSTVEKGRDVTKKKGGNMRHMHAIKFF